MGVKKTMKELHENTGKLIASMDKDLHIFSEALKLACKTLNAVCMTQNYTLGLGQNEQYFIKKAKETLKND